MQKRIDSVASRLAEQLSHALPDLVEAMHSAAEEVWPLYQRPGAAADSDDVRAGLRRIAALFVRVLEEGRRMGPDELVTLHVIGAQRARQGVPPEHLVHRVRASMRALWEAVFDLVAAEDRDLDVVRELSLRHLEFMHDVVDAVEAGHATEREQRLSGRVQAQAAFVDRVLEGHWESEAEIRSQASALGHDLGRMCGLLLLLPAGGQDTEGLRGAASRLVGRVAGAIEGPMRTLPVLHVLVLASTPSSRSWTESLDCLATAAVEERLLVVPVEATAHANALANVYRRAQRYLPLAHSANSGPGVVTVKDLRLYAVLAGIPLADRVEFVRDMLGPVLDLPPHKAEELLETLESVYRRRGRIAEAAAELHLHQNSVRYRLNRIEQLTGLSLDVPAERMHLELAMRLRWVAKAELATLDDPPVARVRARPA